MNFREKAIFIWNDIGIGDATQITALLKEGGFEAAYLHSTNVDNWRTLSRVRLANVLKAAGIEAYASVAVYGTDPEAEGRKAALIVNQYGLAGCVFDIEKGAIEDAVDAPDRARRLMNAYTSATTCPAACCWWPFHRNWNAPYQPYHNKVVLRAAMEKAAVGMPMAYWSWGDDPASAIRYQNEVWKQWREVTDKPLVMAGRAYNGDGGTARATTVFAYDTHARDKGAVGVSWWSMEHALKIPDVWEALKHTPKMGEPGKEEPVDPTKTAIGLFTRAPGWTNPNFDFIVAYAGGDWSRNATGDYVLEPNKDLAPIERQARKEEKALFMLWDFDVTDYSIRQIDAREESWPDEDDDYPLNRLIAALQYRDFDGLIIRVMTRTNFVTKKNEMLKYIAFAAKKFTERANKWLYTTKGLKKQTVVLTCDPFLRQDGAQENFYTWFKPEFPLIGAEEAAVTLVDSYPAAEKPGAIGNTDWRFWFYYWPGRVAEWNKQPEFSKRGTGLMVFNGTGQALRDLLGLSNPTDTIPPSAPTNLTAEIAGSQAKLTWTASTDNVKVEKYNIYRGGVLRGASGVATWTDQANPGETWTYEVEAVDQAGNKSARASVSVTIPGAGGGDVGREEFEDLKRQVAEAKATLKELTDWREAFRTHIKQIP